MLGLYPYRHTTDKRAADSIVARQEQRIAEIFNLLDNQLEGKQFLVENRLSVCDYYLVMLCIWSEELTLPSLSISNLKRFLGSMANLNCVQHVCAMEEILLDAYR